LNVKKGQPLFTVKQENRSVTFNSPVSGNVKEINKLLNKDIESIEFSPYENNWICPMTTHNMILTEERLMKEGIDDVLFVALSFDPERDSPKVLTKFAEIRDIKFDNWIFLTGDNIITEDLLRRFDVKAIPTDSVFYDDGTSSYSIMHTDRISLINNKGILKQNYKGSTANIEELITDIKYLGEEK